MKVAAIDRFGPPSVIRVKNLPMPEVGPGQVLIELHAAGVGSWDANIREGTWRPHGRPKFPLILGVDGAGIVVAKGKGVRRLEIGDHVWSYDAENRNGGFYAEFIAVDADLVGHLPQRLDLVHAGAACVTGLTALQGIDEQLKIRRNETVLIFGATGTVGTLALQFAKRKGARVIATATGRDAEKLVKRLGADAHFDAHSPDAFQQLRELAPDGIDAALALAGGDRLEECLFLVRPGGRIAFPNGVEPEPRKRRGIRLLSYDGEADPTHYRRLARAAEEARLRVPIDAEFSLAQAVKAHRRLAKGHVLGRMVLKIR